ncbi:hypothetical protein Tco_0585801 [Tanacetum coccineum]
MIKMPPRRNKDINDIYEQELEQRFMARMDERFNQIVDQLANRMNDMMNPRRRRDHNSRGIEGEELENPFFEGDNSSFDEQPDRPRRNQKEDNRRWERIFGIRARFLIKMPLRRNRDINDIYEQELKQQDVGIITAGEVKVKSQKIRSLRVTVHLLMNNRIDQDEIKWRIIGIGKGFVDSYSNFQDDKNNVSFFGVVLGVKESMPVYDTDIKDVIEEEEGFVGKKGLDGEEDNIKDVVVVANENFVFNDPNYFKC